MWYVILNSQNIALGVYGSALRDMAEDSLKRIRGEQIGTGDTAMLVTKQGERPRVGQFLACFVSYVA